MATGDQNDFAARMQSALPTGWFADGDPILAAVLAGFGSVWAQVYALWAWLVEQTRIATATGAMLDLISGDLFGATLPRRLGESDTSLRARIGRELWRPRATRAAVIRALTDLTGNAPLVFEPAYTHDTGGYGAAGSSVCKGLAYGVAGGYGSLLLPFQFFVIGLRGSTSPIANVMGYYSGSGWAGGGYYNVASGAGGGAIEYASLSVFQGLVTDASMDAAVAAVIPTATIAWMALAYASPWTVAPGAPTLTSAAPPADGTTGKVALAWTAPATGGAPTSYLVFYRPHGSGAFTIAATVTGTSYTMTGLTGGTSYDFVVSATNAAGPGPQSAALTASAFSTAMSFSNQGPNPWAHTLTGQVVQVACTPNPGTGANQGVDFFWSTSATTDNNCAPSMDRTCRGTGGTDNGYPIFTNVWGVYLSPPTTPGTYYIWAATHVGDGAVVSSAVTVT